MLKRKLVKIVQSLLRQVGKLSRAGAKRAVRSLMRSLMARSRRANLQIAGFVLPTVTMVLLVVVLLTIAITLRSFDRVNNARNFKVDQATLAASQPAIDRARAKLNYLLEGGDTNMPRSTPSDDNIYTAIKTSPAYTFGDETRLKIAFDFNGTTGIQGNTALLTDDETLTTAWKFPVDTDNNGKFDSYTLYGIFFRSPSRDAGGNFSRARNPLEARTPPMPPVGQSGSVCAAATGTTLAAGSSDWFKQEGKLKKSFFVYTATLPITDADNNVKNTPAKYEVGKSAFSGLEFEQDRNRIPLNNNAVWFDDDIEISNVNSSGSFRLNGRVFTNSNLMTGTTNISFFQVSDPNSCFYEAENSKIVVAGNVVNSDVTNQSNGQNVVVHLFKGKAVDPTNPSSLIKKIDSTNVTTGFSGSSVGYNTQKFSNRIGSMVDAAMSTSNGAPAEFTDATVGNEPDNVDGVSAYAPEVKTAYKDQVTQSPTKDRVTILKSVLTSYFTDRTRRVPFSDTVADNLALKTTPYLYPDPQWMEIDPQTTDKTGLTPLKYLPTTDPKQVQQNVENFIGDRIIVGNNLPYRWHKGNGVFATAKETQTITGVKWQNPDGTDSATDRTRQSQIDTAPNLGDTGRDGFWEQEAARVPKPGANTGGLRVITGTGIFVDDNTFARATYSFLPAPTLNPGLTVPQYNSQANIIVWPDTMPMSHPDSTNTKKGDLLMRSTVVYHYVNSSADLDKFDVTQAPAACISSYYDPSTPITARNPSDLLGANTGPDVSGGLDTSSDGLIDKLADGSGPGTQPTIANGARSNNGIVYNAPYTDGAGRDSALSTYKTVLENQARLVYPDGRVVNPLLRTAIVKTASSDRSFSENAAIDNAICSLGILKKTPSFASLPALAPVTALTINTSPPIPHGAIKEASFLDARQVKSLNTLSGSKNLKIVETFPDPANSDDANYTLPLEQRQPLEIRVTEIDLNLLRKKKTTPSVNAKLTADTTTAASNNEEYWLPNSGIIYATREDALPDLSAADNPNTPTTTAQLVSPSDFKLDPTRRPNGIRLINGSNLSRTNTYRNAEKGLILASNLPVYILANQENNLNGFNLHKEPGTTTQREEFTNPLDTTWSNFYTRFTTNNDLNKNFACRQNQRGCQGTGDQWRAATIISDAQSLLSTAFVDGFRSQGDYDLRNNQGNSAVQNTADPKKGYLPNGFWFNNFVTSADWVNGSGYPKYKNSYLTNGVTPIQRRTNFPEYVMEVCPILPVSECKPQDWYIELDPNETNLTTPTLNKRSGQLLGAGTDPSVAFTASKYYFTTARLISPASATSADISNFLQKYGLYARRVAFRRDDTTYNLLKADGTPLTAPINDASNLVALGISSGTNIKTFPRAGATVPDAQNNALWFQTINGTTLLTDSTGAFVTATQTASNNYQTYDKTNPLLIYGPIANATDQPLLVPMLQIHTPQGIPDSSNRFTIFNGRLSPNWTQAPPSGLTYFNAAFVTGNSPSRFLGGANLAAESGGGLPNFLRLQEDWGLSPTRTLAISGNFIQTSRSKYATAPFGSTDPNQNIGFFYSTGTTYMVTGDLANSNPGFRYRGGANGFLSPFYTAATRSWGFDVGLLSQSPDLFAQRFTAPPTASPDEYFRGVSRDDTWVQALLCAKQASDTVGGLGATYTTNALQDSQRPSTCPTGDYPQNPNS